MVATVHVLYAGPVDAAGDATSAPVAVRRRGRDVAAATYLAHPRGRRSMAWKPGTSLAARAAASAGFAVEDSWPLARDGQRAPGWAVGRAVRVAQTAVKNYRRDPEYVVRCAKGLPALAAAFEDAWVGRFRDTPPEKVMETAVYDAFDLAVQHKAWSVILDALRLAATRGNAFVTTAYVELIAQAAGTTTAPRTTRPTQGDALRGAAAILREKYGDDGSRWTG
ncbi:hypothetical protein [Cellulomonas hominis]